MNTYCEPQPAALIIIGRMDDLPESGELLTAASMLMPFGRFKGERLIDLPEPYLVWFHGKGFPAGALGRYLALMYEIKLNGLEKLIRPLLDSPQRVDPEPQQD